MKTNFIGKVENQYARIVGLVLLLFCVVPKLTGLLIALLLVFCIYHGIRKQLVFRLDAASLTFLLLFVAYFVGAVCAPDKAAAFSSLERKLSLIIFPFILAFRPVNAVPLRPIFTGLIGGTFIASILGLFNSYAVYSAHGDFNNSFGSGNFSHLHHPTYFSAFLLIAMCMAWYGYRRSWRFYGWWQVGLFSVFSICMQFFCFSLSGLIFLFFTLVVAFYVWLWSLKKRVLFIACLLLIPVFPITVYHSNIHIEIQVDEVVADISGFIQHPDQAMHNHNRPLSGNQLRLMLWVAAVKVIDTHPFGTGTNNLDPAMAEVLKKYDQGDIAAENYNPHNQYLQTTGELGYIGLFLLLAVLVVYTWKAIRQHNSILLIVTLSLAFNSLFESMLQRQSGIVFYVLLMVLLDIYVKKNGEAIPPHSGKA